MNKALLFSLIILGFTGLYSAETELDLTGKVLDENSDPIQNAIVTLKVDGLSDTTDAEGIFTLYREPARISDNFLTLLDNPGLNGNLLSFGVANQTNVSIDLFDIQGQLVKQILNENFSKGMHTIALNTGMEHMGHGSYPVRFYLVRLTLGKKAFQFKYLDNGFNTSRNIKVTALSKSSAVEDTLEVSKDGYDTELVPVTDYMGTIPDITLMMTVIAPEITTDPADADAIEGDSATFTITSEGTTPAYQWQVDTADISGANDSTYTTSVLTMDDSGSVYRCIVSNDEGADTSIFALLSVTELTPVITLDPKDTTLVDGDTTTLTVEATGTNISFQWQVDDDDIQGADSSSYTTPARTYYDSGSVYRCIVTNNGGADTSAGAILSVTPVEPSITTDPVSATITEGETATFSVTASGTKPGYQWQINSTDIAGAYSSSYTTPAGSIFGSGNKYRCIVNNVVGSDTSSEATLTVQGVSGTFTDSRDGKTYKTVTIGTQRWMAENLNYNAPCINNVPSNCTLYGGSYNWDQAMASCPTGWHLPTIEEWDLLVTTAATLSGDDGKDQWGWTEVGTHLKADSPLWVGFGPFQPVKNKDSFGFGALPGGRDTGSPTTAYIGENSQYWSASIWSATRAKAITFNSINQDVNYTPNATDSEKWLGMSVRCVEN